MARSNISTAVVFFLLFVAIGIQGPIVAQGQQCEQLSDKYKGQCYRNANCAAVCNTEGFPSGICRGSINRRCFCRPCRQT